MTHPNDRRVITDSLGVGVGVGLYGLTFGALSTATGLSVLQTCILSLLAFTGASQFAFIGVIASGGTPMTAALSSVLLGGRNMFYGITLAKILNVRGVMRPVVAHLIIDESTAMGLAQRDPRQARLAYYWTGITIFVMWNLMTLLGAVAGTSIGDPEAFGLDAAVGAAFLGLLWPKLIDRSSRILALVGAAAAVLLIPLTAPGVPIILGGAAAVALGLVWFREQPVAGVDDE